MKIIINENPDCEEIAIMINCRRNDESVSRLLACLNYHDRRMTGMKEGRSFLVDLKDILYFETVDKKTFIYTCKDVFETNLKLYEIQDQFGDSDFLRCSKSLIVNILEIRSILPDMGGRLELTMSNDEKLYVSRQYACDLKLKLMNACK